MSDFKAEADHGLTVNGPNLAAQAIAAGLVDEYHLFITTSVVGGAKRFFPDGVRLDLERARSHSRERPTRRTTRRLPPRRPVAHA